MSQMMLMRDKQESYSLTKTQYLCRSLQLNQVASHIDQNTEDRRITECPGL